MPGTSSHTKICLNGKGLKRVNSHGQGNHYIDLKIQIPKTLTQDQRALLQVGHRTLHHYDSKFGSIIRLTLSLKSIHLVK